MSLDVITLALAKSYADQHSEGGGQVQPDWNQNQQLSLLIETDMLPAVRNTNGAILTDQNGNIVLRY